MEQGEGMTGATDELTRLHTVPAGAWMVPRHCTRLSPTGKAEMEGSPLDCSVECISCVLLVGAEVLTGVQCCAHVLSC